jgi:hypothetical protein
MLLINLILISECYFVACVHVCLFFLMKTLNRRDYATELLRKCNLTIPNKID